MGDAYFRKEGIELFIFSSPVCLHGFDFTIEESLNKVLKLMEFLKNLRLKLKEIYPCKLTEIIDKTHIILISSY
jgi:hypothetical protein